MVSLVALAICLVGIGLIGMVARLSFSFMGYYWRQFVKSQAGAIDGAKVPSENKKRKKRPRKEKKEKKEKKRYYSDDDDDDERSASDASEESYSE